MQEIFQEMESPERMVASPVHGFLSPNGVGKWAGFLFFLIFA
jgi:hypothetical protein